MMKACLNSGSSTGLPVEPLPQEHQCMQCSPLTVNNEGGGGDCCNKGRHTCLDNLHTRRSDCVERGWEGVQKFRSQAPRRHVMRRELGPWTRWIKEAHTGEWYIPTRGSILAERSDNQDWHKSKGCSGKQQQSSPGGAQLPGRVASSDIVQANEPKKHRPQCCQLCWSSQTVIVSLKL